MPRFVGLWLDGETHDLALDDGASLRMAIGAEAVAQHIKQRLLMFEGEWFLDTSAGLPWLPKPGKFGIFDRPFPRGQADALVKSEVLDTPGVVALEAFDTRTFDAGRRYSVQFEGVSVEGPFQSSAEVSP